MSVLRYLHALWTGLRAAIDAIMLMEKHCPYSVRLHMHTAI